MPIKEFATSNLSHILNIDTVVSIVCTYISTKNWKKTFDSCIPLRKKIIGGKLQRRKMYENGTVDLREIRSGDNEDSDNDSNDNDIHDNDIDDGNDETDNNNDNDNNHHYHPQNYNQITSVFTEEKFSHITRNLLLTLR